MTSIAYDQLGKCVGAAVLWTLFAGSNALAQGLPVENGPHWPIGLIFAGAAVLGLVLAYGIMRNRSRTRSEKKLTEDVTGSRYRTRSLLAKGASGLIQPLGEQVI